MLILIVACFIGLCYTAALRDLHTQYHAERCALNLILTNESLFDWCISNGDIEFRVHLFYYAFIAKHGTIHHNRSGRRLFKARIKKKSNVIGSILDMMQHPDVNEALVQRYFNKNYDILPEFQSYKQIVNILYIVGRSSRNKDLGMNAVVALANGLVSTTDLKHALVYELRNDSFFFLNYAALEMTGKLVAPFIRNVTLGNNVHCFNLPANRLLLLSLQSKDLSVLEKAQSMLNWLVESDPKRLPELLKHASKTALFEPLLKVSLSLREISVARILLEKDYSFRYIAELEAMEYIDLIAVLPMRTSSSPKRMFILHCWYVQARFNGYTEDSLRLAQHLHQLLFRLALPPIRNNEENGRAGSQTFSLNDLIKYDDGVMMKRILYLAVDNILFSEIVLRKVCMIWRRFLPTDQVIMNSIACHIGFASTFRGTPGMPWNRNGEGSFTDIAVGVFTHIDFTPFQVNNLSAYKRLSECLFGHVKNMQTIEMARVIRNIGMCGLPFGPPQQCFVDLVECLSSQQIADLFAELLKTASMFSFPYSISSTVTILNALAKHELGALQSIGAIVRQNEQFPSFQVTMLLQFYVTHMIDDNLILFFFGTLDRSELCEMLLDLIEKHDHVITDSLRELIDQFAVQLFVDKQDHRITSAMVSQRGLLSNAFRLVKDYDEFLAACNRMRRLLPRILDIDNVYAAMHQLFHHEYFHGHD